MKKIISLILSFVVVLGACSVAAFADGEDSLATEVRDVYGPKADGPNKVWVFTGQTATFTMSAYDQSELSDNILTVDDFSISKVWFIPVCKVVDVSAPYSSIDNEKITNWDVTIVGILPGRASLQAIRGSLCDVHGNINDYSQVVHIRNGGLLHYIYHLIVDL